MQSLNRGQIRRAVGINTGDVIDGTATSTVDTSSLLDTANLNGGDDEHNSKQVMIYDATGSIVDGETKFVTDYASSTNDATTGAFSATITTGDKYEMWDNRIRINDINNQINQEIDAVTNECLKDKVDSSITQSSKYEYAIPSGFVAIDKVEYEYSTEDETEIDTCDTVWTAGANVTATADTAFYKEGSGSIKNVVAAAAGANEILGYRTFSTAKDLSDCNQVEVWIYSTIATTSGQLELHLDDTAAIASAVETLDLPALVANTWTRCTLTLANPQSDSAILSWGIYETADLGAFNFWIDDVVAVDSTKRIYKPIVDEYWEIVKGTTPYIKLNTYGLSQSGENKALRLTGYQKPTLFSDDTTNSDVDPSYLIDATTGRLLMTGMLARNMDTKARETKASYYLSKANARRREIQTTLRQGTKWV